jgi:hypothetical protein
MISCFWKLFLIHHTMNNATLRVRDLRVSYLIHGVAARRGNLVHGTVRSSVLGQVHGAQF